MNVKAIETEYKGYRFRSRLEARWAVFFDAIGAEWEYEPEGFMLEDGTLYLPDFLLHGVRGRGVRYNNSGDIYVEIKGVMTDEDLHKIEMFPMPIIVFGRIPDAEWCEGVWSDGKPYAYWRFDFHFHTDNEWYYNLEFSEGDNYWTEPKAAKGGGLVLDYPDDPYDYVDNNLTAKAYEAARKARFEHGECGGKRLPSRNTDQDCLHRARRALGELTNSPPGELTAGQIETQKAQIRDNIRRLEARIEIDEIFEDFPKRNDPEERRKMLQSIIELQRLMQAMT